MCVCLSPSGIASLPDFEIGCWLAGGRVQPTYPSESGLLVVVVRQVVIVRQVVVVCRWWSSAFQNLLAKLALCSSGDACVGSAREFLPHAWNMSRCMQLAGSVVCGPCVACD